MNRTPPEANTEYSRGQADPEGNSEGQTGVPGAASTRPGGVATGVVAMAIVGALALLVAEFTALFTVHVSNSSRPLKSVSGGSHHSYAMAVIAVCAVLLAVGVWRGSRTALLGIGALGLVALLIALLGDLGDATASGLILTSSHYIEASSTPSAGFFIEMGGALLLLLASVSGFLLTAPPPRPQRRTTDPSRKQEPRSGRRSAL
jgi:hypothetical protein